MAGSAAFVVHLLQDVHVLRPLVFMAARDFGFDTQLLVSDRFRARDTSGIWLSELESIRDETGAAIKYFGDDWEARSCLTGQGLLIAASESHIHNHATSHNIFRHAPASYLRVTLQHGFECVGFRHGADHVRAYGETASFGADIVCAWSGVDQLPSLAASQAPKLVVTGPTSVLQMARGELKRGRGTGLVCENLHSVRFERAETLQSEFLKSFGKFAGAMRREGRDVRLRPHPGGQFSANSDTALPRNVQLENAPLYRLDLRQFSYGISPPSSVLIDMLLADIPTAVWRDRRGLVDVSSYEGLKFVSSADEWVQFAQESERDREGMLANQRQWVKRQGMPTERAEVYSRFAKLFEAAERMEVRPAGSRPERERILLVTGDRGAIHPRIAEALTALGANGEVGSRVVSKEQLAGDEFGVGEVLDAYGPSAILLSGQGNGVHKSVIVWAKSHQVPAIYFYEPDIGGSATGGQCPGTEIEEVAASDELLHGVDVVYAGTEEQKKSLARAVPELRTVTAPAPGDDLHQGQSPSAFRRELLRIIALGHAVVSARNPQEQKEVGACHAR